MTRETRTLVRGRGGVVRPRPSTAFAASPCPVMVHAVASQLIGYLLN